MFKSQMQGCRPFVFVLACVLGCALSARAVTYTLGASSRWEGPALGTDSVALAVAPNSGTWTATTNATWLHLSAANQGGTGSTNVAFTFDANAGGTRSNTLTVGSQTLTVVQAGATYVAARPVTTLIASNRLTQPPLDIKVDASGNIYIAETSVLVKWSVTNNGLTTLVSGGLNDPNAIALDTAGNVYIADSGNQQIKKWNVSNSQVTTNVASGLAFPDGLAIDGGGNLYIADTDVNPDVNAIYELPQGSSTLVTNVTTGVDYPAGLAVDVAGNVYVAGLLNGAVFKLPPGGSSLTTLAAAPLGPIDVAVDGGGNVDIAVGGAIQQWNAASHQIAILVSAIPNGNFNYNNPHGLAVDSTGNLYYADVDDNKVMEVPYAFVDPSHKVEGATAGSDTLPPVLPATENLGGAFAPTSDSSWLTVTGTNGGTVNFSFTANSVTNRTAHISLLGQFVAVTQTGPLTQSTTTVLGGLTTSTYGSNITFTATVSPPPDGGTVVFYDNGSAVGAPASLSGGVAMITTTLNAGSHPITAVYAGSPDALFAGSSSSVSTQLVNAANVTIGSGLTAVNKPYDGTASATIVSNNVVLSGLLPADSSSVWLSTNGYSASFASAGAGSGISVSVSNLRLTGGDHTNYSLIMPTLTANINKVLTTLMLVPTENPAGFKDNLVLTATITTNGVDLGNATGTVQFFTNGAAYGTNVTLVVGVASTNLASLPRGTNIITAVYTGDGNYFGSTIGFNQIITNHPPTATVYSVVRQPGAKLSIFWTAVETNWSDIDGDVVSLSGINLVTTNGVTLLTNVTQIFYPNSSNVNDQISYIINDGFGGMNTGFINIAISPFAITGGVPATLSRSGSSISANFFATGGYWYEIQRSTNLYSGNGWVNIATNYLATTNYVITVTDAFSDLGTNLPASAYYRLSWHP